MTLRILVKRQSDESFDLSIDDDFIRLKGRMFWVWEGSHTNTTWRLHIDQLHRNDPKFNLLCWLHILGSHRVSCSMQCLLSIWSNPCFSCCWLVLFFLDFSEAYWILFSFSCSQYNCICRSTKSDHVQTNHVYMVYCVKMFSVLELQDNVGFPFKRPLPLM